MTTGIFIFRRDLRLEDNLGLIQLAEHCDHVIGVFILDPYQVKKQTHNKAYFSNRVVQFMAQSLEDLNQQLRKKDSMLYVLHGKPASTVEKLIKHLGKKDIVIGFNEDFSQYAQKRDNAIKKVCKKHNVPLIINSDDYTLISSEILSQQAYKQYGAFYKRMSQATVPKPKHANIKFAKANIPHVTDLRSLYKHEPTLEQGGRTQALQKLRNIKHFKDYNHKRDCLNYRTTEISAHLNFGCISIRETYHAFKEQLGPKTQLIKQLYWRDFFLCAVRFIPGAKNFKHIDPRFQQIKWKNSKKDWQTLMDANTGFLLVDAGIEQLKQTGYMHNRIRMIVGTFWAKYLLINPFHKTYGSQVNFSRLLVDAIGPSQNKMNHHWITEFDFPGKKFAPKGHPLAGRPMNPDNKMIAKWDPEATYVKTWLPHLKDLPPKILIHWNKLGDPKIHPLPIFDPQEKYKQWIQLC